jgi:hypothetical protein
MMYGLADLKVNSISSYFLHFNTVPFLNPPLQEGRAGIAEELAEPFVRLVNKCDVSLSLSVPFTASSASQLLPRTLQN